MHNGGLSIFLICHRSKLFIISGTSNFYHCYSHYEHLLPIPNPRAAGGAEENRPGDCSFWQGYPCCWWINWYGFFLLLFMTLITVATWQCFAVGHCFFFNIWYAKVSTLPEEKHDLKPRVLVTIFIVNADNEAWWVTHYGSLLTCFCISDCGCIDEK